MNHKSPKIIAVLSEKGGCGKTTISVNLTHSFDIAGYKTLLVDSDIQGTARDWNSTTGGSIIPVIGLDRPSLGKDIDAVKSGYDIIVIDGPPGISKVTTAAIKIADLILLPTIPSPYDVWALRTLLDVIEKYRDESASKPIVVSVLSKVIPRTKIIKSALEEMDKINAHYLCAYDENGVVHPIYTSIRVVYPTASGNADTIYTTNHTSAFDAQLEIDAIRGAIEALLQLKGRGYGI